ncbi:DUF6193 family natural product biosynthesis protein [Flavobacterium sp.]|uniref:DUF6193 family natural product biosynthesis protein n=1 Tax=Flavobacterium sp. TaxID=239 RepID=UPI0031DE7AE5
MKSEQTVQISKILADELLKINSNLKLEEQNHGRHILIKNQNKLSQITIEETGRYTIDFWRNGVCLASGGTETVSEIAKALDLWFSQDITARLLCENFNFAKTDERATAFDENREIEFQWNLLLKEDYWALKEFFVLAFKDPVVGNLFPFISLYTLCFSKCTGYPYDRSNLPYVTAKEFEVFAFQIGRSDKKEKLPTNEKEFVVVAYNGEYLGEGNALTALKIVRENLPPDLKRARKGTSKD